jgi:two-component system, OmpR family, response regulator
MPGRVKLYNESWMINMRLLLIEDDKDLLQVLKKNLENAGFAVDIAVDGIEAEYLGFEDIYDLAILDLGLPQRNGIEVLKNWRSKGNALPVLILTARDAWYEKVDGFKAGADDYLAKPFHIEELLMRIRALLHRANHHSAGMLQAGGFSLDEDKQTVTTKNNMTVELTGIEFKLLRFFLIHPEKVLSKSTLTEHIYDDSSDKDSNVIEVYIRRLRRKLGDSIIETRRGQGYIFKDKKE